MSETKTPEVYFILKESQSSEGETIQSVKYPFNALGGLPLVGDLVKLDNTTYRIYLRNFDYSKLEVEIKIYLYMIKILE